MLLVGGGLLGLLNQYDVLYRYNNNAISIALIVYGSAAFLAFIIVCIIISCKKEVREGDVFIIHNGNVEVGQQVIDRSKPDSDENAVTIMKRPLPPRPPQDSVGRFPFRMRSSRFSRSIGFGQFSPELLAENSNRTAPKLMPKLKCDRIVISTTLAGAWATVQQEPSDTSEYVTMTSKSRKINIKNVRQSESYA